jgi:Dolichyl-phosphate-mannose--protein O-mannosyl transferase
VEIFPRQKQSMASTQSKMSQPIAIALLVFLAFAPRFWNLDGLADVVFDEVYYPKFAQSYLQGIDFFDAHPPLGKYLIALGIKLFGYQPWGYRCITALAGALIPIFVYLLVQKWTNRHFLAWLSGVFTALDGLLLVESRYGLINIFLVLFGLCSQLCLISALRAKTASAVGLWTLASGIFLGASISVKWTGLGYLFSAIAMLVVNSYYYKKSLPWYQLMLGLCLIPAVFYLLQWLPPPINLFHPFPN